MAELDDIIHQPLRLTNHGRAERAAGQAQGWNSPG